jgi:hypothetical protein
MQTAYVSRSLSFPVYNLVGHLVSLMRLSSTAQFLLSNHQAGTVIGRQGSTIQALQEKSNARIKCDSPLVSFPLPMPRSDRSMQPALIPTSPYFSNNLRHNLTRVSTVQKKFVNCCYMRRVSSANDYFPNSQDRCAFVTGTLSTVNAVSGIKTMLAKISPKYGSLKDHIRRCMHV